LIKPIEKNCKQKASTNENQSLKDPDINDPIKPQLIKIQIIPGWGS
jgi:hypothetical protein